MSQHKSVFADHEAKQRIDLEFSEENPEKLWNFAEEIGRGAFAVIKKCHRLGDKDKKLHAAKFVKYDDEALKIVKREVAMIQKWSHDKLIHLYEVYIVHKYVVLIMEWVDGATLLPYLVNRQELAAKNKMKPKLSEKDGALLMKQILTGLKYLHDQSIAYLDIKPDNIMVQPNGDIKLVDYDNCRHIVSKQGDVVDCIGTPEITAPESLVYEGCLCATDMWAIGVLICMIYTATSPFAGTDEDDVRRKVAKVEYTMPAKLTSSTLQTFVKGVFKRIPEKRMTLEEMLGDEYFKQNTMWNLARIPLPTTADSYRELKDYLDELESEEPLCASCVLRSFKEDPYDSPESEDEDDEDE